MNEPSSVQSTTKVVYIEKYKSYVSNKESLQTSTINESTGCKANGGDDGMDTRLTALETHVSHINTDIGEIKSDIREIRNTIWGVVLLGLAAIGGLYHHINTKTEDIGNQIQVVERDLYKLSLQNETIKTDVSSIKSNMESIKSSIEKLAKDK